MTVAAVLETLWWFNHEETHPMRTATFPDAHGVHEPTLLTLEEAAAQLRLRSGANFVRFARRHRIPLVRLGHRVVRVLEADLERTLREHRCHVASTEMEPRP